MPCLASGRLPASFWSAWGKNVSFIEEDGTGGGEGKGGQIGTTPSPPLILYDTTKDMMIAPIPLSSNSPNIFEENSAFVSRHASFAKLIGE